MPTDTQPSPDWQVRFDAVYNLEPGQIVKRVAAPYIPERRDYWVTAARNSPDEKYEKDLWFTFSFDGKLKRLFWSTGQGTAGTALTMGIGMRGYQVEGKTDPWKTPLPGDLICRRSASPDDRMNAFAAVLSEALGRRVRFEKKHGMKNTIILSGTYVPPKSADGKDAVVQLVAGPLLELKQIRSRSYGNQSTFCEGLENQSRLQVIDQTSSLYRGACIFSIGLLSPDVANHPDQVQSLLNNVAQQTSLKVSLEPRETDVWTWIDG